MLGQTFKRAAQAPLLMNTAASLDAGLSAAHILDDPGSQSLVIGLLRQGLPLQAHEQMALQAAEEAGALPAALRRLAANWEFQAQTLKMLLRSLTRPAVMLMLLGPVILLEGHFRHRPILLSLALYGLIWLVPIGLGLWLRQRWRHGHGPSRFSTLRNLAWDLGELPYLRALHDFYVAGIPLLSAHSKAITACPVAWVKERLQQAQGLCQEQSGFVEALQSAQALHPDSLQILQAAETAGDLENAMQRSLGLRQEHLQAHLQRLAFLFSLTLQALVYGSCIYMIISFYLALYGNLGGIGR